MPAEHTTAVLRAKTGDLYNFANSSLGRDLLPTAIMEIKAKSRLARLLRAPRLIVIEIIILSLLCLLGGSIPQKSDGHTSRIFEGSPSPFVDLIGLDSIFTNPLFIAVCLLAAVSLILTLAAQLRGLSARLSRVPAREAFSSAPFRMEFERPRRSEEVDTAPQIDIVSKRREGALGSPLLHLGIVLIMLGGGIRALFGVDAVVDLIEGETLPPTSEAWAKQWPALLAEPLKCDLPVTLQTVNLSTYLAGGIRGLTARFSIDDEEYELAVNKDLRIGGARLFLSSMVGIAAMLDLKSGTSTPRRDAVFMQPLERERYERTIEWQNGVSLHLRAEGPPDGHRPDALEVRAMRDGGLLFTDSVFIGQSVQISDEGVLTLHALPYWVQVRGSRDPGLWITYAGFALVIIGVTILFALIRTDTCVEISRAGEKESVFIALKAERLAPLFEEHFKRLVRQEGGEA